MVFDLRELLKGRHQNYRLVTWKNIGRGLRR